jgi:outer membrane protein TolC
LVALLFVASAPASAAPNKLTLDQVLAKTLTGPRIDMARSDRAAAAARVDEADAARLPRLKATAFGTLSPDINCVDVACTQTDPQNFAFRFKGGFFSGQLDVTQPLWTFGKINHARAAARAGVAAQQALIDETAGDLAVDAARAYWGVKLARELAYMLDDGIEEIDKAIERMNQKTGADKPSIQDQQRVAVLLAEARVQRADAAAGEAQALAGLRALTGVPDADVDDAPLEALNQPLPATASGDARPQALAAKRGADAADELAAMAESYHLPDLALVASAVASRAGGVTDPQSVFANDPFNRVGAGVVVALQWTLEPWTTRARAARARAEATKARAQSNLAIAGARYDAETALGEANAAKAKLDATVAGEKAGKAWLASVLQGDVVGTTEPKDLADAYIAWFGMRARWAQAAFQWNVALVRLARAAGGYRPK